MAPQEPRAKQRASGHSVVVGGDSNASTFNTGTGVTVVIHQPGAAQAMRPEAPTLGHLLDAIEGLSSREAKSFAKFIRTQFGELPLHKVDESVIKRVNAYMHAILEARK